MPTLKHSVEPPSGNRISRSASSQISAGLLAHKNNSFPGAREPQKNGHHTMQRKAVTNGAAQSPGVFTNTMYSNPLQAFQPIQKKEQTPIPSHTNNLLSPSNKRPFVQPKLTVNAPGDQFEQEADAMADKVMRMTDTSLNQPDRFNFFGAAVQRKCAGCEEEEHIHRKENSGEEVQADTGLDSYVSSLTLSGQPLAEGSRHFFEPRFGRDFSNVRVHTDTVAAKSAQSINALAYTTGNNIVFNHGQYSPGSESGQRLMAHELTHVVQQGGIQRKIQKTNPTPAETLDPSCNFVSKIPNGEIFHFIVNTDQFVNGEEKRLNNFLASVAEGTEITVLGMASSDGPAKLNEKLSCDRARKVAEIVRGSGKTVKNIEATGGFIGTEHNNEYRSVSVETYGKKDEPKPVPPDKKPQPADGKMNNDCSAYASNAWWLPIAYVSNATCACSATPNSPKYNCIRKFLQDRLASASPQLKKIASLAKELETNPLTAAYYILFVQDKLTPMIYKDHVDAYANCGCKGGPASYLAWMGVTTVPIPSCGAVGWTIEKFGKCE